MKDNDTQTIALDVRSIASELQNLQASRKRHDERSIERHQKINDELKKIGEYIARTNEYRENLTADINEMKSAIIDLVALKNQAKGGWFTLCALATVFSALGSGLTIAITKLLSH